jgi:hypothetical protein
MPGVAIRLVAATAALLLAAHGGEASAQDTGFFGPDQGFEIQPEVDVYYHVSEDARLLLEAQGTSVPTQGNGSIAVGAYGD